MVSANMHKNRTKLICMAFKKKMNRLMNKKRRLPDGIVHLTMEHVYMVGVITSRRFARVPNFESSF